MSDSIRISNAKGLYLESIRDGNMNDALDKYTGDRYTQHSTGVRDGKEGGIEFFTPFQEHNKVRDIQVVRTFEDGNFVFCHVYQNLGNGEAQWVTADIFDTDEDGKITEHWVRSRNTNGQPSLAARWSMAQLKLKTSIKPTPTKRWCRVL